MASDINITMLGPSRVGKTSLLASLYHKIPDVIEGTNLSLNPDLQTTKVLEDSLEKLTNLANYREFTTNDGIAGDDVKKSFYFNLGLAGKKPALRLHFQDYPGGWIQKLENSDELQQVKKFIKDSQAILIPIDSPALFERNEKECNEVNQISTVSFLIEEIFNEYLQNDDSPRLIILVPLKCEKYMRSNIYSEQIQNKVKDRYKKLLTYIKQPDLANRIAVVITPVQTVGNVIFSFINRENNSSQYDPIGDDTSFSPKDTEQPLRYLLRFILNVYFEQKKRKWGLFERLRQILMGDRKLKDSIDEFARGCKNNNEFVILQGQQWLFNKR